MEWWGWAFGGIGATIIGVMLTALIGQHVVKRKRQVQRQRGGRNSTNIQVSGDFTINPEHRDE
jgi:hypothetical protein